MNEVKTTKILNCEKCGYTKDPRGRSYGKYKVIETHYVYSLRCVTCGFTFNVMKNNTLIDNLIYKIEQYDDIVYNQAKIVDILNNFKDNTDKIILRNLKNRVRVDDCNNKIIKN